MTDMSIAHFGTTLIESPAPEGEDQASIPKSGDLERTDRFLSLFGAEVYISNMYPGIGRQYIYQRGDFSDPDYLEKDTFTSYTAVPVPDAGKPRAGEVVFRLTHRDPVDVAQKLMAEELIQPLSDIEQFVAGHTSSLLMVGPDKQAYELTKSTDVRKENHRVYIWTAKDELDAHMAGYAQYFDAHFTNKEDFYGYATAHLLVREDPGISIALLTLNEEEVAQKHSFDIFRDAGYSHFRLGAPDKALVLQNSTEAFPDGGGDVSFIHFQNSYLELVQIGTEIQNP